MRLSLVLTEMKKKVLTILLTVAILWLVFTLIGVKMTFVGDRVVTPAIGAKLYGVYCFDQDGPNRYHSLAALLPDKSGNYIHTPWTGRLPIPADPYTITSHSLAYWSPADQSLCLARLGQKGRWYNVANWLPADTDVCSICASKTKIYLNIYEKGVPRSSVRLDPISGVIEGVEGAVEVRAHENSDAVAVLQPGGLVQFRDAENNPIGGQMKLGAISFWDADALSGLVCSQYGSSLTFFEKGRRKIVTVGDRPYTGLSLCTDRDVVWLADIYSVNYLVGSDWYGQINVYNYGGTYSGQKLVCRDRVFSPMYLFDPTVRAIVVTLNKNTKGFYANR
jgi:hypothetical protein